MKAVFIFDTSAINNSKWGNCFFGNREELNEFKQHGEIVIPKLVIDEITRHIVNSIEKEKETISNTAIYKKLLNYDLSKVNAEQIVSEFKSKEEIPYQSIDIENHKEALCELTECALYNRPPFDGKDIGFKDICIFITVKGYAGNNPEKNIYIVCKDKELKKAFELASIVPSSHLIESFQDFKSNTILSYTDDDMPQRLSDSIKQEVEKENIKAFYENINENHVLEVEGEEFHYLLEMEKGEIISYAEKKMLMHSVESLIGSASFSDTHEAIDQLGEYKQFLTDKNVLDIINAFKDNPQISRIINDDDVRNLFLELTSYKGYLLDEKTREFMRAHGL
jgi:hypothetical protein